MSLFKRSASKQPDVLAAVDLGSNSFHMVVARLSHGQLTIIDRIREMVRLAAGLDRYDRLDEDHQRTALECLARFGERIRDMHANDVRVVGTSTLRRVDRYSTFLEQAEEALGHPVEIISGIEEARLIYQGVVHSSPSIDGSQLVVDIGGGSTEIVCGTGLETDALDSLKLGCVQISKDYFPDGKLSARSFERARLAARLEIQPIRARFLQYDPQRVIGASGTIRAAGTVLSAIAEEPVDISLEGLEDLIDRAIDAGHVDQLRLPELSAQRKPVFAGGLAILAEVMKAFGFDHMSVSDGALREGLLYDMLDRLTDEDARERSARAMEGRYNVDVAQAARVESTAMMLLEQVAKSWKLNKDEDRLMLHWAARLHEIGLDIALSGYHQHGAYLLEHSDMPGFPTGEQQVLACIVAGHRGKFSRNSFYDEIPGSWSRRAKRLTVLLRLAVLLNRSRNEDSSTGVVLRAKGGKISVGVPQTLLGTGPLTWADLEREVKLLADANLELTLERLDEADAGD